MPIKKQKKDSFNKKIIIISVFLVFLFVALTAFQVFKKQSLLTLPAELTNPQKTENQVSEPVIEKSQLDQNGMTQLTVYPTKQTNYEVFSLSVPAKWVIQEKQGENVLELTKNEYKLRFSQPAVGGGACVFPDTDLTGTNDLLSDYPLINDYVEIPFQQGVLRRYEQPYPADDPSQIAFVICENLQDKSNVFEVPLNGAFVNYITPKNPSSEILREMDSILQSMEYK
jgi:hypothetical protein